MLIDEINKKCEEVVKILQSKDFAEESINEVNSLKWVSESNFEFTQKLNVICNYICKILYPNLRKTQDEMENILRAFEGEYIEPGPSGAPSSGGADFCDRPQLLRYRPQDASYTGCMGNWQNVGESGNKQVYRR